jgi:hypothetical protein
MKLKYSIVKIDSITDDIYVRSYGQNVFEFHKQDFNGDWQNIIGEEFNLDPCTAADLSKLEMYGNEAHSVNYSLEDKLNWYTFARNKIRDDLFNSNERLAELDTSRAIEIYSKDTINSSSNLYTFFTKIPYSKMGSSPKIDLSGIKMSDNFIEEGKDGNLYDGTNSFDRFVNLYELGLSKYVIKLPNFPKNLKSLVGTFFSLPLLEDISNIDFSNIVKYSGTFYILNSLKDLSSVDLSNAIEISYLVQDCPNIEYLPKLDNLNATTIKGMFTNGGLLVENAGNINILSEESTVYKLFENFKIKNIGDITIKGSVIGSLIGGCSELEKIGNIELGNINITKNDGNNIYIISNRFGDKSLIDSILEIGNIHIKENISTQIVYVLCLPNSPVKVGDILIDNNNGNNLFIEAQNSAVGNVIVHNSSNSNIVVFTKEVGVFSINNGNGRAVINSAVKKIKAFPYYKTSGEYTNVNSSGFEYWFDYISTPTQYIKRIVTLDVSRHIATPNKNYKSIIPLSDIISVNPEYPYNFKLKSCSIKVEDGYSYTIPTSYFTKTNITKVNSIKLVKIDDSTIGLDLDLEEVMDGSTLSFSSAKISGLDVDFIADIDGQEFYGRTPLILNGTIDFEVTEDISSNFYIEYEDDESPIDNSIE